MKQRSPATSLASYARAIEGLWSAYLERPVVLSQRDWSLIGDWHALGVPLQVVREAVDALSERRRSSPPRGLSAIAQAVEESFCAIEMGRLPSAPPGEPGDTLRDAVSTWRDCLSGCGPEERELAGLLRRLLEKDAAGVAPAELDAELDARLAETASRSLAREAERAVEAALTPFKSRMPEPALRETRRRALVDRLRHTLGLARLAPRRRESLE